MNTTFKAGDIARIISEDRYQEDPMIVIRQDNDAGITICDYHGLEKHFDSNDLEHVTEEEVRDRIAIVQGKIQKLTEVIKKASTEINEMMEKI
jgi:hypothetical protein